MKLVLKLSIMAAALAASGTLLAADAPVKQPIGSGPNPFSDCGIGAAIFKDTAWAAATLNIIWDFGTTAVTSATLSPQTCAKKNVKAAMLIRDSYAQVIEDAARGRGEHLAAVLDTLSCNPSQQGAAAHEVRAGISEAIEAPGFTDQKHLEKAGQLFHIIDQATRHHCSV